MKQPLRTLNKKRILNSIRRLSPYVPNTNFELTGQWTSVTDGDEFVKEVGSRTGTPIDIIGYSVEGKPLYTLTKGTGETKILITSGVHGTERANREGILSKMRDVCFNLGGGYTDILKECTIMFIPTVNPDRMHRAYRNAEGIDINRVIYYLDSPEGVAFLETYRDFKPDVHFDFHEHSGGVSADATFVFAMNHDPNSDGLIKSVQQEAIDYNISQIESKGYTGDYYYPTNTGFGSLTSGLGILGTIAYTTETRTRDEQEKRFKLQKKSFDNCLSWTMQNKNRLKGIKEQFLSNMLKQGDTFTLLQGMNPGAEMYTQATHEEIICPYGYELDNVTDFQRFIDVYDIKVKNDNIVPVNQRAGRMIPHLLDPRSDMKVTSATRVE